MNRSFRKFEDICEPQLRAGSMVSSCVCTNASRYVHVFAYQVLGRSGSDHRLQCQQLGPNVVRWQPPMFDNRTSISWLLVRYRYQPKSFCNCMHLTQSPLSIIHAFPYAIQEVLPSEIPSQPSITSANGPTALDSNLHKHY